MKRLTLALDKDPPKRLRHDAAEGGTTLSALVSGLAESSDARQRTPHQKFRLRLQGWHGELQPGVDILNRHQLFDLE